MRKAGWIAAGVAGTAAVAAAAWYLRDRNLEQPEYFVLIDDGALELRDYPALIAAETVQRGPRDKALAAGIRLIEGYIAGRARGGPRIARTAPVLSSDAGGGAWRTRLIMPARWTHATLPPPGSDVAIVDIPARKLAVHRFAGVATEAMLHDSEAALRAWMAAQDLAPTRNAEHAFYSAPAIPGPLRRNEVMLPV